MSKLELIRKYGLMYSDVCLDIIQVQEWGLIYFIHNAEQSLCHDGSRKDGQH